MWGNLGSFQVLYTRHTGSTTGEMETFFLPLSSSSSNADSIRSGNDFENLWKSKRAEAEGEGLSTNAMLCVCVEG